jgi:ribosomal protein L11 methyltransferase
MAFGTGLHPSTELCMQFMEELDLAGLAVLDVGAGSGILSIGAIRAGAARAMAVEIDPVAARSLAGNVALNDMLGQVEVVTGDIGDVPPAGTRYPVVLANLIARILAGNAAAIARHLAAPGTLIASGIIAERETLVVDAFAGRGLRVTDRKQAGDWVALRLQRD